LNLSVYYYTFKISAVVERTLIDTLNAYKLYFGNIVAVTEGTVTKLSTLDAVLSADAGMAMTPSMTMHRTSMISRRFKTIPPSVKNA
jgi:hypothetical protein